MVTKLLLAHFSRHLVVFTPVVRNMPLKQLKFMALGKALPFHWGEFADVTLGTQVV